MSLTTQLRKAAYAFPIVFALAANANAAEQRTLEVDQLDLSKPVPTSTCFVSNAKGTAFSKLTEVMNKRNQIVVAVANRAVETSSGSDTPYRGEIFATSSDGKEGYDIVLDSPREQMQTTSGLCLMSMKDINVYDVYKLQSVPSEVDKGEMGKALRNSHKNGLKVMMTARSQGGALIVVQYNPTRGGGALLSADANGNSAGDLGYMASMGYSKKAKEMLGIQETQKVALAP